MDEQPGRLEVDAVVVGGGLAGLWAVLHLPADRDVLVIDKETGPDAGSSLWAQGGMAVAVGPEDSPALHAEDTLRAGAGASSVAAVEVLVSEAPAVLEELLGSGCAFDRDPDGGLHLNREGGQTVARSVHAADATGREIMRVVAERAGRRARRLIGSATRLLVSEGRCVGVEVATDHGEVVVAAHATLLATGGYSALWAATTNPETATGDGVALAFEAGAEVADLEFLQFHPTALATPGHRRVLLTEALRGEGAIVTDERGKRFLFDHHEAGELAPRDIVARAIVECDTAYLDARSLGEEMLRERFPNVCEAVRIHGFDLAREPVPVAPAAHYSLGGVVTDLDARTTIPGLYAAGECAATGVHGANRMAGNSLTEACVFGRRAALSIGREAAGSPVPAEDGSPGAERVDPSIRTFRPGDWEALRDALSRGAGLVRTEGSLADAQEAADGLALTGVRAVRLGAITAGLACRAARIRAESRGVHRRADHPVAREEWTGARVTLRAPG